jgi:hypothetical protein
MSRRLEKKPRLIIYGLIAYREGEYCLPCFVEGAGRRGPKSGVKLELDHADNDETNWNPDNIHLCCKAHNLKFRRLTSKAHVSLMREYSAVNVCARAKENMDPRKARIIAEVDLKSGSTELLLNSIYEPGWLNWMHERLTSMGSINKKEAINAGAAAQRCSNTTTARYYDVHTSSEGVFEEFTDGSGHRCIRYRKIDNIKKGGRK